MVDSAAYYRAQWAQASDSFVVSVPLDQSLLLEENIEQLLIQRIDAYGVKPEQLQLRINLESLYRLDQKAVQVVKQLHEAGFGIVMSGLGASQLDPNLLSRVPLDGVALDGTWVQQQWQRPEGRRWIQGLIAMAQGLDVHVHVEGVETETQTRLLARMGADTAEGPFCQDALPAEAFARYLQLHSVA